MKKWIILATALGGFFLALGVLMWQQGIRATAPALGFQTLLAGEEQAAPLVKNYQALPENTPVTRLVVHKNARQLWAFNGEQLLKIYPVSLGRNPVGHKQFEGDGKTPEGIYRINERNAHSAYHKNLGVSYPNAQDIAFAQAHNQSAGGLIKIHGLRNGTGGLGRLHLAKDWTQGCIAVTDKEIDELFQAVVQNAEIEILP